MRNRSYHSAALIIGATLLIGVGCGQSSSSPAPVHPILPPSPSPTPIIKLFVSGGNGISGFSLPVTAKSQPVVGFGKPGTGGMAIDALGDLVGVRPTGILGGLIDVYTQPIVGNTQPAYSIAIPRSCITWHCGRPLDVAFDRAGNLFVAADGYSQYCGPRGCYIRHQGRLIGFAAPLSSSSSPRFVTNAYTGPLIGIAVDSGGIVWAVLADSLPGNLIAYPPP